MPFSVEGEPDSAGGGVLFDDASIGANEITLTSEPAADPEHVSRGWADNPWANLIGAGWMPFRTDKPPLGRP